MNKSEEGIELCDDIGEILEKGKEMYTKAKKERALVAFIDVLGFKNIVVQQPERAILITVLLKMLGRRGKDKLQIYSFSDCMYIMCKVSDKEKDTKLREMVEYLSYIQGRFLESAAERYQFNTGSKIESGIMEDVNMVRGALTYGEIFLCDETSNVFLGTAVNTAYVLESARAKCPGILIDKEILKDFKSLTDGKIEYFEEKQNGEYYIDFMKYYEMDPESIKELCKALETESKEIRKATLKEDGELRGFCESPLEKVEWMLDYLKKYHIGN